MKNIYLITFSILFIFGIKAQTLTQANHAPIIGDAFATKQCDSSTVTVFTGGGSGAMWSYSTMVIHPQVTNYAGVSVTSTGSNVAYPSSGVAVSAGPGKNSFYSSNSTDLKYWGGDLKLGGLAASITYTGSASAAIARYPMVYGTSTTTPVSGTLNIAGSSGTFNGSCTSSIDGTGTLKLPGITFNNIVRINTAQSLSFTTAVSGTLNQVRYDFYHPTSKAPVFSILTTTVITFTTVTEKIVTINANYTSLGVNSNDNDEISFTVFPNPTDENITLSFYNGNGDTASYEIFDAVGKSIKKDNIGKDKGILREEINIESINSGIYFVKLSVGNNSSIQKIIVK